MRLCTIAPFLLLMSRFLSIALACVFGSCLTASARLYVVVTGTPGSGTTEWAFSGSYDVLDLTGANGFTGDFSFASASTDFFLPFNIFSHTYLSLPQRLTGEYVSAANHNNRITSLSPGATVTGSVTGSHAIDGLYLDDDGTNGSDDFGWFANGTFGGAETLTFSGRATLSFDITTFGEGATLIASIGDTFSVRPNSSGSRTVSLKFTAVSAGPTVTDRNINISGASGASGTFKTGDTVTVTWNNTLGRDGDGRSVTGVTVDFSAFGGGSSVAASESSGMWTATYTIGAGSIDTTGLNVSVAATNSRDTTTTEDTTNATVDNVAPILTDPHISISGARGSGGAFKAGDTVAVTWDSTGDNNLDTISTVTVNFSAFGGGTTVNASNSNGTWTATYTILSGSIDLTNLNVSMTATDNAGNTTTTSDSSNATVDNDPPIVTDANISISGASGSGGVFRVGDTVTVTWKATAGGDNNSDTISAVTVNASEFGGGTALIASNSNDTWTASFTIPSGSGGTSLNVSVTATDNSGNTRTTTDSSNATVNHSAPIVTDSNISISGSSGSGGEFVSGDTVTVIWNNTSGGDNNSDTISAVTVNASEFGGGTALIASNSNDTWTASFTIPSGSEGTSLNVSVTAADDLGNTTTTSDSSNATVRNVGPTVTDAHISISGGNGSGGEFVSGDTVTVTWNNTSGGDNNSNLISAVTVNFGAFGGGTALIASNSNDTWTASFTIPSGSEGTSLNVSVTATDLLGNTTTTSDTRNATVRKVGPIVTDENILVSEGSGTDGEIVEGDPVTVLWDNTSSGDGNSNITGVTVDFSSIGGGDRVPATNNDGRWTATITSPTSRGDSFSRNMAVTATDAAENSTTTYDSTDIRSDELSVYVSGVPGSGTTEWAFVGRYNVTLPSSTPFGRYSFPGDNSRSSAINYFSHGSGELSGEFVSSSNHNNRETSLGPGVTVTGTVTGSQPCDGLYLDDDSGSGGDDFGWFAAGRYNAAQTLTFSGSATLDFDITTFGEDDTLITKSGDSFTVTSTSEITPLRITVTALPAGPTVTDGNIFVSGATGTGGAFRVGDIVTVTWKATPDGDDNSDTIASVKVDLSAFGGGSSVAASNIGGVWTASLVITEDGGGIIESDGLNISVTATDSAGYATTTADTTNATLDNNTPEAPANLDLTESSDSGSSSTDDTTNDNTPMITGTGEPNGKVELFFSRTLTLGTDTVDGSGNWSVTATTVPDGTQSLTAKETDAAGNVSPTSGPLDLAIDTQNPTISDIATQTIAEDTNTDAIVLSIGDGSTPADRLTLATSSSDTTLLTNANIILGGSGANRTVTLTPERDKNGLVDVTITVTDVSGNSSIETFRLAVTAVNDGPEVTTTSGSVSYTENDSAVTVDDLVSITDLDDTQIVSGSASITTGFTNGDTLEVNTEGTGITARNDSSTGVLSLSGTDTLANYQSVLQNIAYISISENPTATATTRTITFAVSDANSDGTGVESGSATREIDVTPVNDPPELSFVDLDMQQPVLIDEIHSFYASYVTDDVDADALILQSLPITVSLDETAPRGAAINPSTGTFTWTPDELQGPGEFEITGQATDHGDPPLSTQWTLHINVIEVNGEPILDEVTDQAVKEGETMTVVLSGRDNDLPPNGLTFSLVSGPTGMTVDGASGLVSWTPGEADGPGTYPITAQVSDNGSPVLTAVRNFTVEVGEMNTAPVLAPLENQSILETGVLSLTAHATDADLPANNLTYRLAAGAPAGMTIAASTGVLSWTPVRTQSGTTHTVTVIVTDDGTPALQDQKSFVVMVAEVNKPPEIVGPEQVNFTEDTLGSIEGVTVSDLDAGTQSIEVSVSVGSGVLSVGTVDGVSISEVNEGLSDHLVLTGSITALNEALASLSYRGYFQGAENFFGLDTLVIGANDLGNTGEGGSLTTQREIRLIIEGVNDRPTLTAQDVMLGITDEDTSTAGFPVSNFTANGAGTSGMATGLSDVDSGGKLGIAITGFTGNGVWEYSLEDALTAGSADYIWPAVGPHPGQGLPPEVIEVLLLSDSDQVRYVPDNKNGETPTITYRAWDKSFGNPGDTVIISDGELPDSLSSDSDTASLTVTPVNDPPVIEFSAPIRDDPYGYGEISEGMTLNFAVNAGDVDLPPDTLTYSLAPGAPPDATIDSLTGEFYWPPNESQGPATVEITVRVTDDGTPPLSDEQTLEVTVSERNSEPILDEVLDQTVNEGETMTFGLSASDHDIPPNTLIFGLGSGPAGMTVNRVTGLVSWTPGKADGPGTYPITVRVSDNGSPVLSVVRSFTVYVNEGEIPSVALIGGNLRYYDGDKTVSGANLTISGADSVNRIANVDGSYTFPASGGENYRVVADKAAETPATRGVTALDIASMRRHILALERLDSPYKVLAADVNKSGSVTTFDIAVTRRFILGLTDSLPAGLWLFVPSDVQFADQLKPWPYEEARSYTDIRENHVGQDFVGIKLGDVNGSWTPPVNTAAVNTIESKTAFVSLQSREPALPLQMQKPAVHFEIGKGTVETGDTSKLECKSVNVPVRVSAFENVTSVQFTVEWNPTEISFAGVAENRVTGISADNFGTHQTDDGVLTFSWDDPNGVGQTVEDHTVLFTIGFRSLHGEESVSSVRFADQPTIREASVGGELATFRSDDSSQLVELGRRLPKVEFTRFHVAFR